MNQITLMPYKWCVYYHKVDEEIFYVGAGRPQRAFELTSRNPVWENIGKHKGMQVEIVKWFPSLKKALNFEGKEIRRLMPKANLMGTPNFSHCIKGDLGRQRIHQIIKTAPKEM